MVKDSSKVERGGYTAVTGIHGEISHVCTGSGQPLPDAYAALPFKIEYSVFAKTTTNGETGHFSFESVRLEGKTVVLTYTDVDALVRVEVRQTPKNGLFTQTAEVFNLSDGKLCVKQLYNFFNAIDVDLIWDNYAERATVGVVRSEWGAEGQLYWLAPDELGVIRPTGHKTGYTGELYSPTSLTTKRWMPMLFIKDKISGAVYFVQHLPDGPYCLEIGLTDAERVSGSCFHISCGAGTSERHGFRLYLEPGESYRCAMSAHGCGRNMEECITALTEWRREALHPRGQAPLMFNDYMNCLWTKQNEPDSIAVIDAAAEIGAEGFCFDDGWYREIEDHGLRHLGDWQPAEKRFGSRSFADMISYIQSKGMIAGLWTELEVCSLMSDACRLPDECFLTNEGQRIFKSNRLYFNLANAKAKEYLLGCIARVYEMGIRFIKNDYNGHPGAGVDWHNASPSAGLEQHMRAVNAFYAEVAQKFPDLYLENCSSGAMRADGRTNQNFHVQSVSDCEEYYKMPSILGGTLLGLLPEQIGMWVYPFPRVFWEMNSDDYLTDEYRAEMADGEQTVFNMINGALAVPYLSGKIDKADKHNYELMKSGVRLYRELRPFVSEAVPFFPLGHTHIFDKSYFAIGLKKEGRAMVAIWRTGTAEKSVFIPMSDVVRVEERYPCRNFALRMSSSGITVDFTKPYQAVLIEVVYGA